MQPFWEAHMDRSRFLWMPAVAAIAFFLGMPADAFQSTPNESPNDSRLAKMAGFKTRLLHESSERFLISFPVPVPRGNHPGEFRMRQGVANRLREKEPRHSRDDLGCALERRPAVSDDLRAGGMQVRPDHSGQHATILLVCAFQGCREKGSGRRDVRAGVRHALPGPFRGFAVPARDGLARRGCRRGHAARIMMWAEFAWGLATETLPRDRRLKDLGIPELGAYFPGDQSATILFSLGYPGFQNSKQSLHSPPGICFCA